jgi:hypothetical protein
VVIFDLGQCVAMVARPVEEFVMALRHRRNCLASAARLARSAISATARECPNVWGTLMPIMSAIAR